MELLPLTQEDRSRMLELLTCPQIGKTYMLPDFKTPEEAEPLFQRLLDLSRQDSHFIRGIRVDSQLVGFLNDVETNQGSIEVGYVIHPRYWNRGYASAALRLAIAQLFALGYREVIAGAFSENAASFRVMEKAGMLPLEKQDSIEYRGKVHLCRYYHSIP